MILRSNSAMSFLSDGYFCLLHCIPSFLLLYWNTSYKEGRRQLGMQLQFQFFFLGFWSSKLTRHVSEVKYMHYSQILYRRLYMDRESCICSENHAFAVYHRFFQFISFLPTLHYQCYTNLDQ